MNCYHVTLQVFFPVEGSITYFTREAVYVQVMALYMLPQIKLHVESSLTNITGERTFPRVKFDMNIQFVFVNKPHLTQCTREGSQTLVHVYLFLVYVHCSDSLEQSTTLVTCY
uniref:Uncharacterized protein n=1 Tax=Cacopsylla melanoneura TaxID=428564 RepID=A0A8D8UYD3_9HEMI